MIWQDLPAGFFVLAPMDDVTDTVFRRIVSDLAPPDLAFTEFVNADGLMSQGRQALLPKLSTRHDTVPVIAQLWGKNPDSYFEAARLLANGEFGNFAGIDINMGCPDRTVVKNGCCVALVNNRSLAVEIIRATKAGAGRLPVSVKTRLGFNQEDFSWHELLLRQGIAALTVHGRTAREMSLVPARWDRIGEVAKLRNRVAPQTKIIGNGDIESRPQGEKLARQYNLDGIMIGRGVFHDPYIFASESMWAESSKEEKIALFRRHVALFAETWGHGERKTVMLNKYCKIYINGFDGAKELRVDLMKSRSVDELTSILSEIT